MSAQEPSHSTPPKSSTPSLKSHSRPQCQHLPQRLTRLSSSDLSLVNHALGGPSSPNNLPTGLYLTVIRSRKVAQVQCILTTLLYSILLVLQLILGTSLTALSSSFSIASKHGTITTILASGNTVIAGLLALLHNSGLPDRYKKDWHEFEGVEMFIREVLETGIVRGDALSVGIEGEDRDKVIEKCFEMFEDAKRTVARNKPASYVSGNGSGKRKVTGQEEMV